MWPPQMPAAPWRPVKSISTIALRPALCSKAAAAAITCASAMPPPTLPSLPPAPINIRLPPLRGVAPRVSSTLANTTGSIANRACRRANRRSFKDR